MRGGTIFFAVVSCSAANNGCVSDLPAAVAEADGGGDSSITNDASLPMDAGADTAPISDAAWSPIMIPGLAVWLAAEDLPTASANVAAWPDRSPNANNANQPTVANQPT